MKLVRWKEGKVELYVPDPKHHRVSGKMPVFFNPRAKLSRDLSTLVVAALKPRSILDAMAATGIRGIRYAVEAGVEEVIFNDVNPRALDLVKENASINGVNGEFLQEDVNLLLHSRKFLSIDLDPFGSPSPFLSSLGRSATNRGVVLITATDTAPLSGASKMAAVRKYHAVTDRIEWHRELAVRILMGYVQHHLMVWEKALIPVFSYFVENHVRVIGRVVKKPSMVTETAQNLKIIQGLGPLWTGYLHDSEILEKALKHWDEDYTTKSRKVLHLAREEVESVGYLDVHRLAREVKIGPPPMERLVEELRALGYQASRSSLEPKGIKTNAPIDVVKEVVVRTSSRA